MNVAVLAQAAVHEIDDAGGNGEAQTLTASTFGKNESVDAENAAVHIDQRSAAVAGINGSVGLDVGDGLVGIGLARYGADHPHGDGVLQSLGTADGEHQLAYARTLLREQGQRREIFLFDLEEGEIGFLVHANEAGFEDVTPARGHRAGGIDGQGQGDADALRAIDYVGVGDDVTGGIDDHAG